MPYWRPRENSENNNKRNVFFNTKNIKGKHEKAKVRTQTARLAVDHGSRSTIPLSQDVIITGEFGKNV